jgi:hypothetical protein
LTVDQNPGASLAASELAGDAALEPEICRVTAPAPALEPPNSIVPPIPALEWA